MGTGDGRFVLAGARARPNAFIVGIDAVAEAMADASRRACARPSRGGVENVMFVCTSAETLPGALAGTADEITINYPWGSLLRAIALPDAETLACIAALAKPGAKVTAVINMQPLRDATQAERLGLSDAALLRNESALRAGYACAGLDIVRVREITSETLPATSWGRHLAVSKREIWQITAKRALT